MRKEEILSSWEAGYDPRVYPVETDQERTARALPFNETLWSLFSQQRTRLDTPLCSTMPWGGVTTISGIPLIGL
jgi:hypothetical protein